VRDELGEELLAALDHLGFGPRWKWWSRTREVAQRDGGLVCFRAADAASDQRRHETDRVGVEFDVDERGHDFVRRRVAHRAERIQKRIVKARRADR
jgi:hypothetical protein